MAWNNYGNGNYRNDGVYQNRSNSGHQNQQQQPAQAPAPQLPIEEQIAQRLDTFKLILDMAEERGIERDTLLMGAGLTAWVTSMVGNFKR